MLDVDNKSDGQHQNYCQYYLRILRANILIYIIYKAGKRIVWSSDGPIRNKWHVVTLHVEWIRISKYISKYSDICIDPKILLLNNNKSFLYS